MKTKVLLFLCFLLMIISSLKSNAQNPRPPKKKPTVETIWDIPHKTIWQKWMWPHRSAAFEITKERIINYDTAYIKSYHKKLVIALPISTRFLKFSLNDLKSGNKLTFSPNLQYNLGLSINSRWATFILHSGVKVYKGDPNNKGKTNYQDYQLNLYGRKLTTDMFVQYYSGFYIKNSKDFNSYSSVKPYAVRSDVYALHMAVSSNYIVNNKKFSYKSSFAFAEQQKKSAGSLLLGIYYSYFDATANEALVSPPFRGSFDSLSYIRSAHTHNFGMNLGYIYTLVFLKKYYATASLVQGFGGEQMGYIRENNSSYQKLVGGAGKLHMRLALRYDNEKYFIGSMVITDYVLLSGKSSSTFDYSYGKFLVYIGYRFSILKAERKLLRNLKIIDY